MHIASLDGKLLIMATSRNMLERQIRLYRHGERVGDALAGFSPENGDIARLFAAGLGGMIAKNTPKEIFHDVSKFVPNAEAIFTGLESAVVELKASPENLLRESIRIEAASARDAEILRTLAKTGLIVATAQIINLHDVPAEIVEMMSALKIGGSGYNVELLDVDLVTVLGCVLFSQLPERELSAIAEKLSAE